jgi:hypothetical protein
MPRAPPVTTTTDRSVEAPDQLLRVHFPPHVRGIHDPHGVVGPNIRSACPPKLTARQIEVVRMEGGSNAVGDNAVELIEARADESPTRSWRSTRRCGR